MATWAEVVEAVRFIGATPSDSNALWWLELARGQTGRTQKLAVCYEVMPPDLEFVQIKSAFGLVSETDVSAVIRQFGQLLVGGIGFTPVGPEHGGPANGLLNLVGTFPLRCIDLSEVTTFHIYLSVFASCADQIETQLGMGGRDRF